MKSRADTAASPRVGALRGELWRRRHITAASPGALMTAPSCSASARKRQETERRCASRLHCVLDRRRRRKGTRPTRGPRMAPLEAGKRPGRRVRGSPIRCPRSKTAPGRGPAENLGSPVRSTLLNQRGSVVGHTGPGIAPCPQWPGSADQQLVMGSGQTGWGEQLVGHHECGAAQASAVGQGGLQDL